jgi:hypothetical protein
VIAHRLERRRNADRPVEPPDTAYLASLGLDDMLPRWEQRCADLERIDG